MQKEISILLDKMGIDYTNSSFFDSLKLERLVVDKESGNWNFYLLSDKLPDIDSYLELEKNKDKIASNIYYNITNLDNNVLLSYYKPLLELAKEEGLISITEPYLSNLILDKDKLLLVASNIIEEKRLVKIKDIISPYYQRLGYKEEIEIVVRENESIKEEIDRELKEIKVEPIKEEKKEEKKEFKNFTPGPRPRRSKKRDEGCILGLDIKQMPIKISMIQGEDNNVIVEGNVFGVDYFESSKSEFRIITLKITDYTDSILCKVFCNEQDEYERLCKELKVGRDLLISGYVKEDSFAKELVLNARDIMPITKHNFQIKSVEELADTIRRAFSIAQSGRKGPVLIDIPKDITSAECEYTPMPKVEVEKAKEPKKSAVERAVELIRNAKKPLIYVGGGAILSNVGEDLVTFAEKIDAPVASSLMGLGAFPYDNPLHLGLIGMHGHYECNKAAHDCDVLITCGARFSDRVAGNRKKFAPNAEILHIDIDSAEMDKNIVSNYHLRGDLAEVLPILTREIEQLDHSEWRKEIETFRRPFKQLQIGDYVNPQTLIEKIDAATPDDTIVVTDVGQHQLWAAQFYKFKHSRTLLTSGGLGTMGYSMGAAMGGQMGCPDKTVVMFAGDGGFHMNLSELATMCSYNIPVKMFIMNNTVLGMVRQWQKLFYENRFADTDPHRATDFVKVAEGFGVKALRISTNDDIDAVLKEALEYNGPVLVDCRISPDSNVLPMIPPGGAHTDIIEKFN